MSRHLLMRGLILLGLVTVLAAVPGCESGPGPSDIPAQTYAALPDVLGAETGSLAGQVSFPSEYSQRSVSIRIDQNTFVTQPDGRFLVTRIPVGTHHLALLVKGFEPIEREVTIAPDDIAHASGLTLKLARGTVLGRLVFLDGGSAAKLPVRLEPMGGQTQTDGDGIFQFVGVSAGEHQLRIEDERYYTKALTVALAPNETRNLGIVNVFRRAGVEKAALPRSASGRP